MVSFVGCKNKGAKNTMSDKLVTLKNLKEFKAKCDTTYAKVGTGGFANATLERLL